MFRYILSTDVCDISFCKDNRRKYLQRQLPQAVHVRSRIRRLFMIVVG